MKTNENGCKPSNEIKPASEAGLMRKTKSELVQIILHRDSEFVEDKEAIKNLRAELLKKDNKISTLNKDIEDFKTEINDLNDKAINLNKIKSDALKQAGETKLEVTRKENRIKEQERKINELNANINTLNRNIEDLEEERKEIDKSYKITKVFTIAFGIIAVTFVAIVLFGA